MSEEPAAASAIQSNARPLTRRSTRTVTLNDVAGYANVSPQTVSRSLRSPNLVSESTLEKVLQAISETGYVPNLAASNLASNRSMTVTAIIPTIAASIFSDAVHGLAEVLSPNGYQLFIGSTDYRPEREEQLIRAFLGRRPDGIFIVGTSHTQATRRLLKGAHVPIVETWNLTEDPIDSVVGFSNSDAIRAVVDYAVGKGYRHPTFAGSMRAGDARALERRQSFETAVQRLLPEEPIRVVDSGTNSIDMETGRQLLDKVLEEHAETDVLMFTSDVFAAGAILECLRRGIAVPGQIAITGFGGFDIAGHLVPGLTTVAVPNQEIGTRAGELLLQKMSNPKTASQIVDLGFSVVSRESA